ncbi:MAG: hypothetical protein RRY35_06570, partial [Clostridiales bacterium]
MSRINNISKLLNLKDPNIFFKDSCVSEECMKGILVKVFEGTLTYHLSECPKWHTNRMVRLSTMVSRQPSSKCLLFTENKSNLIFQ